MAEELTEKIKDFLSDKADEKPAAPKKRVKKLKRAQDIVEVNTTIVVEGKELLFS